MIEILSLASPEEVADLKRSYLASLPVPLDGMWESGFIPMASHWELRHGDERAGYMCIADDGKLLQFYVVPAFENHAAEFFSRVIAREDVRGAMVSTFESVYLSLCLDVHKTVRVHTYLYHDTEAEAASPEGLEGARFTVVRPEDQPRIEAMQRASLDVDLGAWLTGYLQGLISRGELFVLTRGEEILGTGECRVSQTQPPHADLGVIVARDHRRLGLATHILRRLKVECRGRDLVPICSTTAENVGAQKSIARAGFVSRYRMLEVDF